MSDSAWDWTQEAKAFSPKDGWLHLNVWKEGLLSRMGHDLLLAIEGFEVKTRQGNNESSRAVQVSIPKDSFNVLEPTNLSAKDKRDILKNIQKHLPGDIHFDGVLSGFSSGRATISGTVRIGRLASPVSFPIESKDGEVSAKVRLSHRSLQLKPFRAPLGVIRLKDEVDLSFSFRV